MQDRNRFIVIIQPDWKKSRGRVPRTVSFRVHRHVPYYIILGIMMLVCFGVNGSRSISKNIYYHVKTATLEQSLERLHAIEQRVDAIGREQRIVRAFLGIEENTVFDSGEFTGKGGSRPDNLPGTAQLDAKEELDDMVPLHKRVHDLYDAAHDLATRLSKMSKKLSCTPTIMPVKSNEIWITSWFGWRRSPFTGLRDFHKGLDLSSKRGTPIMVTADGTVEDVGYDRFLGNYIIVAHDGRFSTKYAHLLQANVKKGQKVKRGQVIALMGNTGVSTGNHLHYEVLQNQKNVDPYNYILNQTDTVITARATE